MGISDFLKYLLQKDAVWAKGNVIPGFDPAVWRRDSMGSVMRYSDYGDRDSGYGWEIDHTHPDGPDELWNLRPLYWRNNVTKSDKLPAFSFASFINSYGKGSK
jgi:hypothetical protein